MASMAAKRNSRKSQKHNDETPKFQRCRTKLVNRTENNMTTDTKQKMG